MLPSNQIQPVILIQDLYFSYDQDISIYDGACLTVNKGEYIGVIGPNGGGKTTLMKLIMGFLQPNRGAIKVFGKNPNEIRQLISYVPQHAQLDKMFPISLIELVLMGRLSHLPWYGIFSKEDKEAALHALEQVGLAEKKNAIFGSLSGGQVQRGLIARALVSDPQLLLLDEPTANVDIEAEEHIYDILNHLQREKSMTILMVTHDLETAFKQVNSICLVEKDIKKTTPQEICDHFTIGLYHKKKEINTTAKG